jgi:hypothetical protein
MYFFDKEFYQRFHHRVATPSVSFLKKFHNGLEHFNGISNKNNDGILILLVIVSNILMFFFVFVMIPRS